MSALVASFLVAIGGMSATNEALQWNPDYGAALQATRVNHRPLLVLIDKPADPQKGSTEVVLQPDDAVGDLLAAYTLCYIDANSQYGQSVADVFRARQYPFAAVIDSDGRKVLDKWTGTRTATQWIERLGGPAEAAEAGDWSELVYRGQDEEEPQFSDVSRRGRNARTCRT